MIRLWPITEAQRTGAMASWLEFLRIEADLAMTFIDCAGNQSNPANAARSLLNARTALAEIQRGLMKPTACGLDEGAVLLQQDRCIEIESALAKLRISR